ncbi:alpha/beta fold hydrolase [Pseudooceanicola sp. HF7]|uniref:alpha/beta fold hydrolase n=1 Tax=Pseudooceanicola sp. HF7 TaxID=2721560 RepID=UPI00142FC999|nr:alpha/beta hydrolase [Pseudooceanicola sp. HF7]NIZ10449.1 alpha/beta hydrolase [Pseudooceanicola sp. HF7]
MPHRLIPALLLLILSACSSLPGPERAGVFPMLEDGQARKGIHRVILLIPGAFESVNIFAPALDWHLPDTTVVAYRFPGMDGLPQDHRVDMDGSAQLIADYVNDLDPDEVYVIGYSTGGPIAIETAERLTTPPQAMALISSAAEMPSAIMASLRGAVDVAEAMLRVGTTRSDAALTENYRTLLYGREHYQDSATASLSQSEAEEVRAVMVRPSLKLSLAHSASLMTWRLDADRDLSDTRIGFFHGGADPVFPVEATQTFAARVQAEQFLIYPGQGHLLYETSRRLFDDIRDFFAL